MFKNSNEFRLIKEELTKISFINEYAIFECFADEIFTFGITKDNVYIQFDIICSDCFSREIMISDLLELKNTTFFSCATFLKSDRKTDERIAYIEWSIYQYSGLN